MTLPLDAAAGGGRLSELRVDQGGVDITPVFSVKWHDSRY